MGIMEGRKGTRCGRWVHASKSTTILPGVLFYFYKSTDYASLSNVYRKKGQVGGFETGFVTLSEGYLKGMGTFKNPASLQVSMIIAIWTSVRVQ